MAFDNEVALQPSLCDLAGHIGHGLPGVRRPQDVESGRGCKHLDGGGRISRVIGVECDPRRRLGEFVDVEAQVVGCNPVLTQLLGYRRREVHDVVGACSPDSDCGGAKRNQEPAQCPCLVQESALPPGISAVSLPSASSLLVANLDRKPLEWTRRAPLVLEIAQSSGRRIRTWKYKQSLIDVKTEILGPE